MLRKNMGLALVLAGGLSAWTLPGDFAQTAHDVASPLVGDEASKPSASPSASPVPKGFVLVEGDILVPAESPLLNAGKQPDTSNDAHQNVAVLDPVTAAFVGVGVGGAIIGAGEYYLKTLLFNQEFTCAGLLANTVNRSAQGMVWLATAMFPASILVEVIGTADDHGLREHFIELLNPVFERLCDATEHAAYYVSDRFREAVDAARPHIASVISPTIVDLNTLKPAVPASSLPVWAEFDEIIDTLNMTVSHGSASYSTFYSTWRLTTPGASFVQGQFSLIEAPTYATLSLTHLTSAAEDAPNGGYSPIDLYVNGTRVLNDFDVAELHGDHGWHVDHWRIDAHLRTGSNLIRIELEDSPWAATHYWIRNLRIQEGVVSYTVETVAWANGSVEPNGEVNVIHGECQRFTATPDPGFVVNQWFVDGATAQIGGLTFELCDVDSDHSLYVLFKAGPPPPHLVYPNGDEMYCQCKRLIIAWEPRPDCGNVQLVLNKTASDKIVIAPSTPDSGSYTWYIPCDQMPDDDYGVELNCLASGASDSSDASFTILSQNDERCDRSVIRIHDCAELQAISSGGIYPRNGYYELANDIDCDGINFLPLGRTEATWFRGTLDGKGHRITGLRIDRTGSENEYVGLFTILDDSAIVKNLMIECQLIHGYHYVGTVAGFNSGHIINTHVTVEPGRTECDIESVRGYGIGGLVGENYRNEGSRHNSGLIQNCSADRVEVEPFADQASKLGGLVGENSDLALILWSWTEHCDVDGDANLAEGRDIGGIIGENYGGIVQSYSLCDWVDGKYQVGGIAGSSALGDAIISDCYFGSTSSHSVRANAIAGGLVGTLESGAAIERSYMSGNVSASSREGACVGECDGGVVESTIWNTETAGVPVCVGDNRCTSKECTGVPGGELKQRATFSNWDFDHVWWLAEGVTPPQLCGAGLRLPAPQGFMASTDRYDGIYLEWDETIYDGQCRPYYQVLRANDETGPKTVLCEAGRPCGAGESGWRRGTTLLDQDAGEGQTYAYWVKVAATIYATDTYGTLAARESELSNYVVGIRTPPPLDCPQNVTATDGLPHSVLVCWDTVQGATHYRVYRADSAGAHPVPLTENCLTGLCFADSSVVPLTEYYYWVSAAGSDQCGRESVPCGSVTGFACVSCGNNADCNDGSFCNGTEVCEGACCKPGAEPCRDQMHCDEDRSRCVCLSDAECNDGIFCNGVETCIAGECVAGAQRCTQGEWCDEHTEMCLVIGDSDGDGDIDLADFAEFALCFSGSSNQPGYVAPTANCRRVFDLDGDGDVDLADFKEFQSLFAPPP